MAGEDKSKTYESLPMTIAPEEMAATEIIVGLQKADPDILSQAGVDVADIQADVDLMTVDTRSDNYRSGVAQGLSMVLQQALYSSPDKTTLSQLKDPAVSEIFAAIAAGRADITPDEVTVSKPEDLGAHLETLRNSNLIHPTARVGDQTAWGLSPFGKQTFLGLINTVLAESVDEDLLVEGVRHIVKTAKK